jgi:hypothetical protein
MAKKNIRKALHPSGVIFWLVEWVFLYYNKYNLEKCGAIRRRCHEKNKAAAIFQLFYSDGKE